MIKTLFVLDIDDTLTSSESQHQTAFMNAMASIGIADVNEKWSEYEHMTDSFIFKENYERSLAKSFSFDCVNEFESYMMDFLQNLNPVTEVPGASAALSQILETNDCGICCATGSLLQPALQKLRQAKLPVDTKLVIGSNANLTREEIVQAAIGEAKKFYGVSGFKQIISVGDGLWDWQAAKNLELDFIGVGAKNELELKAKDIVLHMLDWSRFDLTSVLEKFSVQ